MRRRAIGSTMNRDQPVVRRLNIRQLTSHTPGAVCRHAISMRAMQALGFSLDEIRSVLEGMRSQGINCVDDARLRVMPGPCRIKWQVAAPPAPQNPESPHASGLPPTLLECCHPRDAGIS